MAYYADLASCDYFIKPEPPELLKAIGWLECNKPYSKGNVSHEFFTKLCQLIQQPFYPPSWPVCAGYHRCSLCQFQFSDGFSETRFGNFRVTAYDKTFLLIPGDGFLYIAPVHTAHCIDAHYYRPPEEFGTAVMRCPEMRSRAYYQALLTNGGRELKLTWKQNDRC